MLGVDVARDNMILATTTNGVHTFSKYKWGLLLTRTSGGNGVGAYMVTNGGPTPIVSQTDVTISIVNNSIKVEITSGELKLLLINAPG